MKSARVAAVLGLLGLFVAPASAQSPGGAKPGAKAGGEVGLSMSRPSPDLAGESVTRGPGLLAGAWVAFQPWVPIGIELEVVYAQKHSHLSSSTDLKLDYVELPILAKLKLFKSIYMLEGIALDFPVTAKLSSSGSETDVKSSITSPDIGMIIAGGIPFTRRLAAEFRYEGGFKTIGSSGPAPNQRNRSLSGILRITR